MWIKNKIRTKLFIIGFFAPLVTSFVMIIIFYTVTFEFFREERNRLIKKESENKVKEFEMVIEGLYKDMALFLKDKKEIEEEILKRYFEKADEEIEGIYFKDKKGKELSGKYYFNGKNRNFYISHKKEEFNGFPLSFNTENGVFIEYINVYPLLEKIFTSDEVSYFITNEENVIIFSNILTETGKVIDKNNYHYFFLPFNLKVFYAPKNNFYLNNLKKAGIAGISAGILISLLFLSILLPVSRNISISIEKIKDGLKRFARGDFQRKITLNTGDEINEIGDEINKMAEKLFYYSYLFSKEELSSKVIHTLKTLISRASLMIINLEKYHNEPEYIKDTTLTLKNMISKMKEIIKELKEEENNKEEEIYMVKVIEEIIKEYENYGIKFNFNYEKIPKINFSEALFRKILRNIFTNSIESAAEDLLIEIDLKREKGYVVLKIKDNGKGMEEKILDKVFDPFFTTKREGLGLGLFEVKLIVEEKGGKVKLWSQKGKGTEITILIPHSLS